MMSFGLALPDQISSLAAVVLRLLTEQNLLHLVVLVQLNGRMLVVAVGRAKVLHQRDPVAAAEVDELDVLDPAEVQLLRNSCQL